MKKKFAVLFALMVIVSALFVGCTRDISGKYNVLTSFGAVSSEDERAELSNEGYDFLSGTEVEFNLELTKDGSYKIELNPETTKASIAELMDVNIDKSYESYVGGDPESFAKFYGLESTADVEKLFQESYEESKESIIEAFVAQLETIEGTGTYAVDGRDITVTPSNDESLGFKGGEVLDQTHISFELSKSDNTVSSLIFELKEKTRPGK